MKIKLLSTLFCGICLFTTSCVQNSSKPSCDAYTYFADNPLEQAIKFTIDDKEYIIEPKTNVEIPLNPGKHTLSYNGSSVKFFTRPKSTELETIFNPTLSNYILIPNLYMLKGADQNDWQVNSRLNSQSGKDQHTYNHNGASITLRYKNVNSLFIYQDEHKWRTSLNEQVKEEKKISNREMSKSKPVTVQYQIVRERDVREIEGVVLPEGFKFPQNTSKLSELEPYEMFPRSMRKDCYALNKEMDRISAEFKKMVDGNPKNFTTLLYDFTFKHSKFDSNVFKECSIDDNSRESRAYLEMIKARPSYIQSLPTLILKE